MFLIFFSILQQQVFSLITPNHPPLFFSIGVSWLALKTMSLTNSAAEGCWQKHKGKLNLMQTVINKETSLRSD